MNSLLSSFIVSRGCQGCMRKLGSRRYGDYTQGSLKTCLEAIRNGMSTRVSAEAYTTENHYEQIVECTDKLGYPATFTNEEERAFVSCIHQMSEFAFPVTEMELRQISRTFLNKKGGCLDIVDYTLIRFYFYSKSTFLARTGLAFLKRHEDLTVRFAINIKRSRAALSCQQM